MTYQRDILAHDWKTPGWHATNLAIHAVTSTALYASLRYWFHVEHALIGAILFAVHPLGTASVASIAGRSSLLCGMFYALGILAFLAGAWPLVLPIAYLGMKSKEEIITLPFALLIISLLDA